MMRLTYTRRRFYCCPYSDLREPSPLDCGWIIRLRRRRHGETIRRAVVAFGSFKSH